jgi:hypothetical protein
MYSLGLAECVEGGIDIAPAGPYSHVERMGGGREGAR